MERFWDKVDIRSTEECWPWLDALTHSGYGRFWHEGKNIRAHRFALSITAGEPTEEAFLALHSCDNTKCCNPSHLRWGTVQDNSDDMVLRKRSNFGERSPKAKITEETASTILRMRVEGLKVDEIASEFGLGRDLVMNIYTGAAWTHLHGVNGNPTLEELKSSRPKNRVPSSNRVLTDEMIDRIFSGRMSGMTAKMLSEELGIPEGTISPVFSGLSFSERLGKFGNPTKEELISARSMTRVLLTEDDLNEISSLFKEGWTSASIAEKFGVGKATISRVKNGNYSPSRLR